MITNRIIQQLLKLAKPNDEDDDIYGFNDDNEEINNSFSFSNDDEDDISFDFDDNKQKQISDNNAIDDAFNDDVFNEDTFKEDAFSEDAFSEDTTEKKQEIQQAVLKADAPLESWTDAINTKEQLVKAVHSIYKDNLETLPKHIFNVFIK